MCTCASSNVQVSDFKPLLFSHPQCPPLKQYSFSKRKKYAQFFLPPSSLPTSDNHHSTFSACEFNYTKCLISVEPLNICLSVYLISLSVAVHVTACARIPVLFKAILYPIVYTYIFMSIPLDRDIWVAAFWGYCE